MYIVDAEIWSSFVRSNRSTNVRIVHEEKIQVRDTGGFAGVNPLILKSVQSVYGKSRFEAWRNCREFIRSCPLSLGDEYLIGMYLWSVLVSSWHMPVHDVLPEPCSCHSSRGICPRERDEGIAELSRRTSDYGVGRAMLPIFLNDLSRNSQQEQAQDLVELTIELEDDAVVLCSVGTPTAARECRGRATAAGRSSDG
ncbi:hypothetical protein WN943_029249 [Citrus x changshan-huyou]